MGHATALQSLNRNDVTARTARSAIVRTHFPAARYAHIKARHSSDSMRAMLGAHPTRSAPDRRTRVTEERVMLQITLDESLLATFRRNMFGARDGLIQLLRVQPDPRHTTRVRVWLGLTRPALHSVIALVLRTLPEAEIGRIAPA